METASDESLVVYGYVRDSVKHHNVPDDVIKLFIEYIKPPPKQRNVLILRDIPSNTDKNEILSIFETNNCSKPLFVIPEVDNNWFVHFRTEQECVKTAIYLQCNATNFKGQKLRVRVKSMIQNTVKPIKRTTTTKSLYTFEELERMNLKLPKRDWIVIAGKKHNKNDVITISQFNCLAQSLCRGHSYSTTFKCDAKYLKWRYRSKRILYEILQYKSDIICLCEVDKTHFDDFFYPNMKFKYDGVFLSKNKPNVGRNNHKIQDGIAIFWDNKKFVFMNKFECILGEAHKTYHTALGIRLKYKYQIFDVWLTHLKAGRYNKAEGWRFMQCLKLKDFIDRYSKNVPVLLCGDLNSHFDDLLNYKMQSVKATVYPFLVNKNENGLWFESIWNDKKRNNFSTFAGWMDRDVKCCLDYIMIGHWSNISTVFRAIQVLNVWHAHHIQKFKEKLPNKIYPSDHLLISAKLEIKMQSQ